MLSEESMKELHYTSIVPKCSQNLTTTALKASSVVILHYYCTNKPPCSSDLDDPLAILLLSCRLLISHCPPVSVVTRQKRGTKGVGLMSVWWAVSCVVVYRWWRMPLWFIPGHYSSIFLNANWRRWGLCWSDSQPTFLPGLMWETDLRRKGLLLQILQVDKRLKIVPKLWLNVWSLGWTDDPSLVSSCYAPSDPGVTTLTLWNMDQWEALRMVIRSQMEARTEENQCFHHNQSDPLSAPHPGISQMISLFISW